MREFRAHGAEASESLVRALMNDRGGWARAVLSQCFRVPKEYAEALLAGEAEWTVPNKNTIIIGLAKKQSP